MTLLVRLRVWCTGAVSPAGTGGGTTTLDGPAAGDESSDGAATAIGRGVLPISFVSWVSSAPGDMREGHGEEERVPSVKPRLEPDREHGRSRRLGFQLGALSFVNQII